MTGPNKVFTGLWQVDRCLSWEMGNFLLITILQDVKTMHTCTVYRVRVWLGVWKESLNCDGPQFHKTNNHLSPHLKHKKPSQPYNIWNPYPVLGQEHKCGGIKFDNGVLILPLLIIGSPVYVYIQMIKNLHRLSSS